VLHVSCPKVVSWIPHHKLAHHNALKSNFVWICEDTRENASLPTRSGLGEIQWVHLVGIRSALLRSCIVAGVDARHLMSSSSFCFDGLRVLGVLACQTLVPGFESTFFLGGSS
jgi:hypothetical protein